METGFLKNQFQITRAVLSISVRALDPHSYRIIVWDLRVVVLCIVLTIASIIDQWYRISLLMKFFWNVTFTHLQNFEMLQRNVINKTKVNDVQ